METLIKEIESLIKSIDTDTSRKDIIWMSHKLIELAKYQWSYKRDLLQKKTKRDIEYQSFKDDRERQLKTKWKDKISDAELCRWADSQEIVKKIKTEIGETQSIVEWIDPLMTAYYNYINSVKFESKQNDKTNEFINNINDDPF
jgi:hypothetical protein